ncbi:DUF11 domain-containing protein [Tenacibaculum aquimarinum]|uniref:DUF11 domain-containing protein n=1 Tax=Tenacibaculum aquimarinum TaxID=2910675 RepID=UPI001F0A6911|nr:DUF11 domain-containing protein [Tenacibaculum aquimarinum]MCH3884971.1 DUF11 domain-containing protein [Tenacibaculum aquimarinum]
MTQIIVQHQVDTVEFTISDNEAPGHQLPTGYTLTDTTPSQGSYEASTGVWTIGTIANQAGKRWSSTNVR